MLVTFYLLVHLKFNECLSWVLVGLSGVFMCQYGGVWGPRERSGDGVLRGSGGLATRSPPGFCWFRARGGLGDIG